MQFVCIAPFGDSVPGDVAEVPDGAAMSPLFWQPSEGAESPAAAADVQAPAPQPETPGAAEVAAPAADSAPSPAGGN